MSWSAHDFEAYVIQRHLGARVSLLPLLVGTYAPDTFTKWFVYGIDLGFINLAAEDPAQFHRGWPGGGSDYFWAVVAPADPLWGWLGRRLPEAALLAFYRAGFFYGTSRLIAWTIWAHVQNSYVFDFSWGGPSWIPAVTG